jgi:dsDNA-binding SOS-regulon protein
MNILAKLINKVKQFFTIDAREAARMWYAENKDRLNQVRRIYSANNADKLRAYNRHWHEIHNEEVKKRKRLWYANHRQEMLDNAKRWRVANPDKCREISRRQYLNKKRKAKGGNDEAVL